MIAEILLGVACVVLLVVVCYLSDELNKSHRDIEKLLTRIAKVNTKCARLIAKYEPRPYTLCVPPVYWDLPEEQASAVPSQVVFCADVRRFTDIICPDCRRIQTFPIWTTVDRDTGQLVYACQKCKSTHAVPEENIVHTIFKREV